ncbi:MAG: hypothetical protein Q4G04_01330 [bacterium]|nr:hypothetical protein [bacterium]
MKKTKTINIDNNDDKKLSDKIIDLCLWYQIEDSHRWMDIINLQIESCQMQLKFLEENKPFWFQKKKLEEHKKQVEELENQIYKYYENLGNEVDMIFKLQQALNKEGTTISYEKLVELLKNNNAPIEVELILGKKHRIYTLSKEGYYVLKDKKDEDEMFSYWLRDCLLDTENDTKCIKIIKYNS